MKILNKITHLEIGYWKKDENVKWGFWGGWIMYDKKAVQLGTHRTIFGALFEMALVIIERGL